MHRIPFGAVSVGRSATAIVGLVLLIAAMAAPASSQDVRIQASVNSTTIGTEEALTYSVEIGGTDLGQVRVPEPPAAENLRLVQSVPSTSRNVSIVNGQINQSVTYRWSYRPVQEGEAILGSTTVIVDDEPHQTERIRIAVVDQLQRPSQPRSNQRGRGWPFNVRPNQPSAAAPDVQSTDLFIRAFPSKRRAYMNEQVIIEYRLYAREQIQLRQSRLVDSWDAEGFWREELEVDVRPVPEAVVENGLRYNAIVLKRVSVFPTRPGELTIDPLTIETEVYRPNPSNDPFSTFFPSGNFQPVELSSPAVTIDVQPLPDGAPEDFDGAVGQFRIAAGLGEREVEVGESVQVDVRVSGSGNVATLSPPALEPPGVFETYDPQISTRIDRSGTRISGSKTVTHVLVPRSNGTFEFEDVTFSYFDPDQGSYRRTSAPLGTLRVTGTAGPLAAQATRAGLPVDDIASIKVEDARWHRLGGTALHARALPYAALLLPLIAIGVALLYERRASRLASDVGYARSRRAHPLAKKHLRRASTLLKEDQARPFYAEIERALLRFVGNRLDMPETGLTRHQLDAKLRDHGLSEPTRRELAALLDECEQAQFAPVPPRKSVMETAIDRASALIVAINEQAGEPARTTAS